MKHYMLGIALVLVTGEAWAHPACSGYQTPGRDCTEMSHDHILVFERGGRGNPDTTLIIGGPPVSRTLIAHHDEIFNTPRLLYFYRIIGDVQVSSANPD